MIPIIDYSPLWKTMKERKITKYRLIKMGFDPSLLHALKYNKNIEMLTLEKLCKAIGCTPNDIVAFVDEVPPVLEENSTAEQGLGADGS